MEPLQILVIDADPVDVIKLKVIIEELGHVWLPTANSLVQARESILLQKPDLIICDLNAGEAERFEDIVPILEQLIIPILFITKQPQDAIYEKLTQQPVMGYLVKPIHRLSLRSYLERVYPAIRRLIVEQALRDRNFLLLRDFQNKVIKVSQNTIRWVNAQGNYCDINTADKRYIRKVSLNKLLDELDERFVRVHKKYAVNLDSIDALNPESLQVGDTVVPIGNSYRSKLKKLLKLRQKDPGALVH